MSSAGRCIARSTSSGMVVGPGIARNSRPARTTIFLFLMGMLWGEGMQGNDGEFKLEHHDNASNPSLRALAKQSIAPNDELWIASVAEFFIGPAEGGTRWLLAMTAIAAGPCGGLVSQRIGNRLPDLVLHLGRGRAGNDGGRTCSLLARLDQAQNPHLAVGVIEIAAAVAPRHSWPNSRHLIFGRHHSGGFEVGGEQHPLGVDVGIDMKRDGPGVSADADASVERRIAEPHRTRC